MTILYIFLGWVIGATVAAWPLTQVVYSWLIGWPIAKRFERLDMILEGKKPSRRFAIAGVVNLLIVLGIGVGAFAYASKPFLYGAFIGIAMSVINMVRSIRNAGIEAYKTVYPQLTPMGQLLADADLSKHGIVVDTAPTVVPQGDEIHRLEKLCDDVVYIIECLAEDLTGEAKHSLSLLKDEIPGLCLPDGPELCNKFSELREDLVLTRRSKSDIAASLSGIRRQLANRIEKAKGHSMPYYT